MTSLASSLPVVQCLVSPTGAREDMDSIIVGDIDFYFVPRLWQLNIPSLSYSLPESIMDTYNKVLTFESVDEILWCDHSNEFSLTVLLMVLFCFARFGKIIFEIFLEFLLWPVLGVKGLKSVHTWSLLVPLQGHLNPPPHPTKGVVFDASCTFRACLRGFQRWKATSSLGSQRLSTETPWTCFS